MDKKLYMASCTVCGRSLFKGKADSYMEGGCPKCKSYLQITFTAGGVKCVVSVTEQEKITNIEPKR